MFENLIEKILVKLIGDYLENIDAKNLKASIWSGKYGINVNCIKF